MKSESRLKPPKTDCIQAALHIPTQAIQSVLAAWNHGAIVVACNNLWMEDVYNHFVHFAYVGLGRDDYGSVSRPQILERSTVYKTAFSKSGLARIFSINMQGL